MNVNCNKHLPGLLMLCLGLLHVPVQHNLAISTSAELHKNKDHIKIFGGTFWENKKFSSNLYKM